MAKKITKLTVDLTAEEVLALRYIHSNWAHSNGNAPFCDAMSEAFLEKLGGHLEINGLLWEHPIARKWYDSHEDCAGCGRTFSTDQLRILDTDPDAGRFCHDCLKDEQPVR